MSCQTQFTIFDRTMGASMNFVKRMSAGALALLAFATSALAQTYPTRPITLIVP